MVQVVLVSGKMGSGKSTLVKAMQTLRPAHTAELKFAGPIYKIHDYARTLIKELGIEIPPNVAVKDGPLLQLLGTEWGRKKIADDIWVRCAKGAVKQLEDLAPHWGDFTVVFSDCRFVNEFQAFPGAITVRLECDREIRKARCEQWRDHEMHPSETDLDDYAAQGKFDFYFNTETGDPLDLAKRIQVTVDEKLFNAKKSDR